MLLAIDAGNTNIVFAVYNGEERLGAWRCKTDSARTADEYAAFVYQLFSKENLSFSDIDDVIISSVVPEASFHLKQFCDQAFGCHPFFVKAENAKITVKLNKPEEIGSDRLVNAVAVAAHYQTPAVVLDFGTATTFDVVDGAGAYCGGVIAPGPNVSMDALHRAAAKLPKVSIRKPDSVIGRDTVGAMTSGLYWGYISMIEGMLDRMTAEMKERPFVIATGGLAGLFAEGTDKIDVIDDDLTLKGLLQIYKQSK